MSRMLVTMTPAGSLPGVTLLDARRILPQEVCLGRSVSLAPQTLTFGAFILQKKSAELPLEDLNE